MIKYRNIQKLLPWAVASVIRIYGLVSTSILITTNTTAAQFMAAEFASKYLDYENKNNRVVISH
jgi:hypothetical protein